MKEKGNFRRYSTFSITSRVVLLSLPLPNRQVADVYGDATHAGGNE
jgi:hypothetical protein